MGQFESFDVLDWLNCHRGGHEVLKREELYEPLCFVLMWNLFEKEACDKEVNLDGIHNAVEQLTQSGSLTPEEFQPYLAHFQGRYLTNGEPNDRFGGLRFLPTTREGLAKESLLDVLQGNITDTGKVVEALLVVVYRLRNNLFHGTKNVYTLPQQDENFAVANRLLGTMLDLLLELKARLPSLSDCLRSPEIVGPFDNHRYCVAIGSPIYLGLRVLDVHGQAVMNTVSVCKDAEHRSARTWEELRDYRSNGWILGVPERPGVMIRNVGRNRNPVRDPDEVYVLPVAGPT